MAGTGPEIEYPTAEQVCDINYRMIKATGGRWDPPDNGQNLGSLEYVLYAISSTFFGVDRYPSLKEKAAGLAHHIISRHVFNDGNKRTGMQIALEFLEKNSLPIRVDPSLITIAEALGEGSADAADFLRWLHEHQ